MTFFRRIAASPSRWRHRAGRITCSKQSLSTTRMAQGISISPARTLSFSPPPARTLTTSRHRKELVTRLRTPATPPPHSSFSHPNVSPARSATQLLSACCLRRPVL
eukprot:768707-Hanusia_phi.AAC.7